MSGTLTETAITIGEIALISTLVLVAIMPAKERARAGYEIMEGAAFVEDLVATGINSGIDLLRRAIDEGWAKLKEGYIYLRQRVGRWKWIPICPVIKQFTPATYAHTVSAQATGRPMLLNYRGAGPDDAGDADGSASCVHQAQAAPSGGQHSTP